jgi:hypothetical protein
MGLLDTWQEWKNRYSTNKQDRESLQTAGGMPGPRIGMQGYQAPDNAYTGLAPDQRDRLGQITQKRAPVAPLPSRDRLGRLYPPATAEDIKRGNFTIDAAGNKIKTPGTLAKKQTADAPTNKVYQDAIMRGGKGANIPQDLNWWQKLSGMFNSKFDLEGAKASWNKKGGFEGLMANPAFTMGLAFMQSAAEGKTMGQGALDNLIKAGGISHTYKKIIEDRKQEPIQATAADMAEVESLLKSVNIEEGNWLENFASVLRGGKPGAEWSAAVEEIAVKYQEKISKWQKANKNPDGTPMTIRQTDKLKIMQDLIDSGKIKKKDPWLWGLLSAGTLTKQLPPGAYDRAPKINTANPLAGGFAEGGQIQKGQPAIVGEGGPEYFLPKESGKILSNDDSRIFAMLLTANPQLQNVSRTRSEKILRNRFPEYFE